MSRPSLRFNEVFGWVRLHESPGATRHSIHGSDVCASYEEVIYDDAGQLLTASLADYAIPTAGEVPAIKTVHLDAASPSTVGGFRGMGEGGTIGAPAAIANALADALAPLGAEIFELPMTSERLFRLIEMVKARVQGE